jgi:PAS domain S-box-containing protein
MNLNYLDRPTARPAWLRYGVAIAAALVALPMRFILGPELGFAAPYLTFFPAVIFSSWFGGFGPSVVTTLLGATLGLYFFVPPILSFQVSSIRDVWGSVRFVSGSLIISWLFQMLLRIRRRELEQQRFAAVTLASIGDAVLTTDIEGRVIFMNAVATQLTGWTLEEASNRKIGDVLRISRDDVLETRTGAHIPVDNSTAPLKDEKGRASGQVLVFRDTTERRKAERQLAESQQQMSRMLKSISDGFAAIDRGWCYTYVNAEAARQLGRTQAELIGHSIRDLFPAGLPDPLQRYLERAMSDQIPVTCEVVLPVSGATFRFRIFPAPDGLAIYSVDISLEKKAAEVNAFLAAIVESSNEAIIGSSLDGIATAWNAGAQRIFGYSAGEMIGQPLTMLSVPDRLHEMPRILDRIRGGERVEQFETVRRAKDGGLLDIALTVSPIRGPDGSVIGASKVAHDITERKASYQALRNSETRLAMALEAGSMGVWEWRLADGCMEWSPQLEAIHGLQPGTFGGTLEAFQIDIHAEDRARVLDTIKNALAGETEYRQEYRIVRPDRNMAWLEMRGRIHFDDAGVAERMVGICMDITVRKHVEEELLLQAERLARSNADLRSFAYAASHDLQEPLRIISTFSELLLRRYKGKLDAGADELIASVVDSSLRMGTLIKDLLNYSRLINDSEIPSADVDLNEALQWALDNVQTAIEESGASIHAGPLPTVRGDRVQLAQLFQNLIGNAIKYRGVDLPDIRVSAVQNAGEWVLSVCDNGLGIDPAYHERIFGVFKRLHGSEYPGTGIGLALCKRIVERHGGRIWVESEKGKGSTFHFSIATAASAAS